jgi:KDO2-lipid IV(A) lauroyltransferase
LQRPWYGLAPALLLLSRRVRGSLRVNLELCYPELEPTVRRELARKSVAHGVAAMLELGPLWRWERERVLGLVQEVVGREHWEAACAGGRGIVLITPHLGAWELTGLFVSAHIPLTALYRPPRVATLDPLYRRARERFGARLVPANAGGVRELYRALRRGEAVGLLPDQDPGRGAGEFVPFFGIPANTSTLAARLMAHSAATPLFVWAERLANGAGFRLHFAPIRDEAFGSGDLLRSTAALNGEIERIVRSCPEQYLWTYRRFRQRPDGERNPYRHGHRDLLANARVR